MPFLDVAELLSDPEIAGQAFDVIQIASVAGTNGESVLSPTTTLNVIGSVQPARSFDLQRLPDGEFQKGALKIKTTFALTSGGAGKSADVVRWPAGTGAHYTIQTVDDWSQFGVGFCDAIATLADINP